MSVLAYLNRIITDLRVSLRGTLKQEHGLRLLVCIRVIIYGLESRRSWHDFHDRARE